MPYGSKNDYQLTCAVTLTNAYPGGSRVYNAGSWPSTFPSHAFQNYSRSGTNASGTKGSLIKGPPGTFVRVAVRINKGPRLPYKVWSKRLNKWVWAREPITIYKLKRVKSKQPASKGLDLPPNALNFSSSRVSYYGGDDGRANGTLVITNPADNSQWSRTYTGALWTDFMSLPSGSSVGPPSLQSYTSSTLSDRFNAALTELGPKALSKLYSDVKSQKVNFAQALAERGQTSAMILDLCSRLVRALGKAKHGNLAGAAAILFPKNSKELANDVLVFQYGIRPLISDIKGCVELLQEEPQLTFDVIARRTKKLPRELVYSSTNMGGICKTNIYSEGTATVLYKCRVKVTDPYGQFLSQTGISDASLLAYELTPWSFVLDWLIPLGNYLKDKGAFAGLEIVHLHKTEFAKEFISYERQFKFGKTNDNYWNYTEKTVGFVNERIKCVRSVISNNLPKLPFPSFKDPVSLDHIINSIALLRQLRR